MPIIDVKAGFTTKRAFVTYNPEQVNVQDLIKIIVKAGYQASVAGSERVTLPIQGMSCASCVRRIEEALVTCLAASININPRLSTKAHFYPKNFSTVSTRK